jgi:hypothetical protein
MREEFGCPWWSFWRITSFQQSHLQRGNLLIQQASQAATDGTSTGNQNVGILIRCGGKTLLR